jgi:hypothetical protein
MDQAALERVPVLLSSRPNGLRMQAVEPGPISADIGRTGLVGPGSALKKW